MAPLAKIYEEEWPCSTMGSDREQVRTYVPPWQKEEWKEKAEEWNMSQSEFVRTMVQAGKLWFEEMDTESIKSGEQEDLMEKFRGDS